MTDDLLDCLDDPKPANTMIVTEFNNDQPPPPATVNPFSLIPYQAQWKAFKAVIAAMLTQAQAITVHDQESAKNAVSLAATAKKKEKEIESSRKGIVTPYNDFVSAVNRLAKDCLDPLKEIKRVIDKKINEYDAKQRLEMAKAQEAARIEAKRIQAEIDANALAAGVQAPVVVTPVLPDAPGPIRTEAGTAYQRTDWTHEIVNPHEVPREYLMVDERAIKDAVKRGIREIAGVRIFQVTKTNIRA